MSADQKSEVQSASNIFTSENWRPSIVGDTD